ncbi:MAG: ATP-binding protein [Lachnospiraceae bacterium]|nr:ATP-binding protein [Lachnospiraceae bacterium]
MKFDTKMINKLFFSLLPVQIMLVAVGSINGLIDGAIASNYIGASAMGMIGLYAPLQKVIECVTGVLLGGSQILCGRFLGKNQLERTRGIFSLDMVLLTVIALLFTLGGIVIPGPLAVVLGADETMREGLTAYIFGLSFGMLPQFMSAHLTAFLQIEQQQKRTYAAVAVMAVVNVSLDILFVQELGLGMLGLGLATTLSYWASFVVMFLYYLRGRATITFDRKYIDLKDTGSLVKIGAPGAVTVFCLAVRGLLLNYILMMFTGRDGVSALSALNTCGGLLFALTAGEGAATRLLSSIYIGEEDRRSLSALMKIAMTKGVGMVACFAAVVIALAEPISYIFFKDTASNVYLLTVMFFRIYPFCMPLSAIAVIMGYYHQSFGRMKVSNVLSVMDGMVGVLVSSAILAPMFGAVGVWVAHVLNGVYTTIVLFIYAWMVKGRMPRSIEDMLAIPDDFGVNEDHRLEITIRSESDVTETSARVMDFCHGLGIDPRRSYYAGLCLEEMADNVVKHGFSDGRKHTVDVRVVSKEDSLLLRMKDDCKAFDPKEKLELIDPEDITHNIGIRTVGRISKEMSYHNVLGLNVLTIEL